jgi:phytoene synthase
VEIIRDLRQDAIEGRIFLPHDWLGERGVSPVALQAEDGGTGTRSCLQRLASISRRDWQTAQAALDAQAAPQLRGLRVLGGLHATLLDRIERRNYAVGRERIAVGPIASLWTAWRAARQHGRHD